MRTRIVSVLVVVLVLGVALVAVRVCRPAATKWSARPPAATDASTISQIEAQWTARKERIKELIRLIETHVQPDDPDGAMALAAYALGELRATDAVPVLIKEIDYKGDLSPRTSDERQHPAMPYPCRWALCQMGNDAVRACTGRLAAGDARVEHILYVVRAVYGPDLARTWLLKYQTFAQSPAQRANLDAALKILDKLDREEAEAKKGQAAPPESKKP